MPARGLRAKRSSRHLFAALRGDTRYLPRVARPPRGHTPVAGNYITDK